MNMWNRDLIASCRKLDAEHAARKRRALFVLVLAALVLAVKIGGAL